MTRTLLLIITIVVMAAGLGYSAGPDFTYAPPQTVTYWTPPAEFGATAATWTPPTGVEYNKLPWMPPPGFKVPPKQWDPPADWGKAEEWEEPSGF